jgi:hypothetical protein
VLCCAALYIDRFFFLLLLFILLHLDTYTHTQVEYQFSDINLVANEFLLKIMNKDTEGYGK